MRKRSSVNVINERVLDEAKKFIELKDATIRSLAKILNVAKSTLYDDLTTKLKKVNYCLYIKVQSKLHFNKSIRHIRGGFATKMKYTK